MTTIPPAQPRPPSSHNRPAEYLQRRQSLSKAELGAGSPTDIDESFNGAFEDVVERPSKRRRVEGQAEDKQGISGDNNDDVKSATHRQKDKPKYLPAGWTTAIAQLMGQNQAQKQEEQGEPPPLPVPPWGTEKPSEKSTLRSRTSCRTRANVPVPNTPDTLACPENVPRFEHKRPADHFPWTGTHPEDVLSEANVRSGYCDRAPNPTEKELNTAKAPLYNAFKHRYGLESLSALFQMLMEQKVKSGTLSSTSSFKPPPRVTLTEAKRRLWIQELADPTVHLRKLSRTIPQGIRGQALLEQCLVNAVPLSRALWFIKCVGANEIRTLKRKGVAPNVAVSVEIKWLKDWTTNIEQFIESHIQQISQPNWQENMQYVLSLSMRLYLDNLMDRDHYLDWAVKSFASCALKHLALYLMIVQLYRADIIRFRKRTRYLAEALLTHSKTFPDNAASQIPLAGRLKLTIRALAMSRPSAFVLPRLEQEAINVLNMCLNKDSLHERLVLTHVEQRNRRFIQLADKSIGAQGSESQIANVLDHAIAPYDINRIETGLLAIGCGVSCLVNSCLNWAVSRFRTRPGRTYLVARLIRRFIKAGNDVNTQLLEFFATEPERHRTNISAFRQLFADFSRSKTISVSRFMQQLTIYGLPRKGSMSAIPDSETSAAAQSQSTEWVNCASLLQDIFLEGTTEHIVNFRNNLLARAGFEVTEETNRAARLCDSISMALEDNLVLEKQIIRELKSSCWSLRYKVSSRMRQWAMHLAKLAEIEIPGRPPLPGTKAVSLNHFANIRAVLDATGDLPIMADVLRILATSTQERILASIVDTIHYHAMSFSAIGAFESLQGIYCGIYVNLRRLRPNILLFATSLLDLNRQYPSNIAPAQALQRDLIRGDRARALAACSPFSDGVAESLTQAGETFVEDFDAILQAETNMNELTMTTLFTVLANRIAKADDENVSALCQLLSRLKLLKRAQGDALIKKWLTRIFAASWSEPRAKIVNEMLLARSVDLETLFDISNVPSTHTSSKFAVIVLIMQGLGLHEITAPMSAYTYSLALAARRFQISQPLKTVELVLTKVVSANSRTEQLIDMLPDVFNDVDKINSLSAEAVAELRIAVNTILEVKPNGSGSEVNKVFDRLDTFSMPFCHYKLKTMSQITGKQSDQGSIDSIATSLSQTLLSQDSSRLPNDLLHPLLSILGSTVGDKVRDEADHKFMELFTKSFHSRTTASTIDAAEEKRLANALDRVISLGQATSYNTSSTAIGMLIERFALVGKVLGAKPELNAAAVISTASQGQLAGHTQLAAATSVTGIFGNDNRQSETISTTIDYFVMLLQMAATKTEVYAQVSNTTNPAITKQLQTEQIKLVVYISMIATQPSLGQWLVTCSDEEQKKKISGATAFALDVAARFVDEMSDETRTMCARFLKERLRDDRMQWLLGSVNMLGSVMGPEPGKGLRVVQENKGNVGEFKPKSWDILESGGGKESDSCLGLGLFGASKA